MTDDSRVMQVLHTTTTDAIGNAARDAIIYGTGVMIITQEMQICHVPMEKYLELSQASVSYTHLTLPTIYSV